MVDYANSTCMDLWCMDRIYHGVYFYFFLFLFALSYAVFIKICSCNLFIFFRLLFHFFALLFSRRSFSYITYTKTITEFGSDMVYGLRSRSQRWRNVLTQIKFIYMSVFILLFFCTLKSIHSSCTWNRFEGSRVVNILRFIGSIGMKPIYFDSYAIRHCKHVCVAIVYDYMVPIWVQFPTALLFIWSQLFAFFCVVLVDLFYTSLFWAVYFLYYCSVFFVGTLSLLSRVYFIIIIKFANYLVNK